MTPQPKILIGNGQDEEFRNPGNGQSACQVRGYLASQFDSAWGVFSGGESRWRDRQKGQALISTSDFDCRLIAVSESLRIFSIRGGKEREFLLKICGMLDRGDGHRDFFAISENGDWDIFVGGQKKCSV